MLSVTYAECHKKPFMLSAIMLNIIMLSVIMLNVVMFGVIMAECRGALFGTFHCS
jgi:hypothetical protein